MGILLHQTRTFIKLYCLCSFISSFPFRPIPRQTASSTWMYMSTQHQSSSASTMPFAGITFSEPISTSLASMGIISASPIQKAAISDLVNGLSAILHAETGSGKTLAYILPLLKKLEITSIGYQNTTPPIQAFIIVPTKELAVQVAADIISLLRKASLMKSTGTANETPSEYVHLCLSTNRQGLDNVQSPIVIGTPVKIVDAMRMSSANTFKSIHYIVLDEVDRLLSVMGKYATAEEKQKANDKDNPTEMILSNILMRVKKTAVEREAVQIIAVSATVGRPLRRELCRIVSGGTTFEGKFPVIRGDDNEDNNDNRNNQKDINKKLNNKRSNDGSDNNSIEDFMELSNNNKINNNINSSRKVGIPSKIKHQCVLVDCEIDDISTKIVKAKEKWLLYNKINTPSKNNNNNSNDSSNSNSNNSNRGILFVPRQADVKQVVGMLRFWGLKECVDLQVALGLENAKPIGNTQQQGVSNSNNRRIYNNNRGGGGSIAGDNKNKAAEIDRNRVPEVQRKVSDIIALAQKSGLGASSLIIRGSSGGSGSSDGSATGGDDGDDDDDDDEIGQLINQQVQVQQQQQNNNNQQNEDALFVAPVSNARGLHLQNIETVLITHCPKTMDEYLHMAGRTGRMSAMPLAKTFTSSSTANYSEVTVSSKGSRALPSSNTARRSTVISFVNYDELKRLQSWQVPLGIELEILFD